GLPELLRVHLAETLVALQCEALAAGRGHRLEQPDRAVDRSAVVAPPQHRRRRRAREQLLEERSELVELAGLGRAEQGLVDDRRFLRAAQGPLEMESLLVESPDPAAVGFLLQRIKAPGNVLRRRCCVFGVGGHTGMQDAGDRGLLDYLAIVAAVQSLQDIADGARLLDQVAEVAARALTAGGEAQSHRLDAGPDERTPESASVLEVLLGLAARDLVERRLRNEEMAAVDQARHLPVEERQQQRSDMGAVDVGVGHDDDLVVAQLFGIELVAPDTGAERGD